MMALNGSRAEVPLSLPFIGATTDRKVAAATESCWLSGCVTDQGAISAGFFGILNFIFNFAFTSPLAKDGAGVIRLSANPSVNIQSCCSDERCFRTCKK